MKRNAIAVMTLFCVLCSGYSAAKTEARSASAASFADQISEIRRDSGNPEIVTLPGEFVYDTGNIYEAVGIHDYVFAGTVTEINGAEYPLAQRNVNNEGKEITASGPMFTNLSISVTEGIKGDLTPGDQVTAYKSGGYDDRDGVYYLLYNDVYPEVGQEYLFLASVDPEGVFWLSAPKTTIPLESYDTMIATFSAVDQTAERQSIIDTYTEAYQNEIPYTGEIYGASVFSEAYNIQ